MRLIIPVLLNCLLVLGIYLIDKHTPAKRLLHIVKQVIIGILFGCVSAFSSSYGVQWLGTVVNVRDAAPLSAGLIFGAPAGKPGCEGLFRHNYWQFQPAVLCHRQDMHSAAAGQSPLSIQIGWKVFQ